MRFSTLIRTPVILWTIYAMGRGCAFRYTLIATMYGQSHSTQTPVYFYWALRGGLLWEKKKPEVRISGLRAKSFYFWEHYRTAIKESTWFMTYKPLVESGSFPYLIPPTDKSSSSFPKAVCDVFRGSVWKDSKKTLIGALTLQSSTSLYIRT